MSTPCFCVLKACYLNFDFREGSQWEDVFILGTKKRLDPSPNLFWTESGTVKTTGAFEVALSSCQITKWSWAFVGQVWLESEMASPGPSLECLVSLLGCSFEGWEAFWKWRSVVGRNRNLGSENWGLYLGLVLASGFTLWSQICCPAENHMLPPPAPVSCAHHLWTVPTTCELCPTPVSCALHWETEILPTLWGNLLVAQLSTWLQSNKSNYPASHRHSSILSDKKILQIHVQNRPLTPLKTN